MNEPTMKQVQLAKLVIPESHCRWGKEEGLDLLESMKDRGIKEPIICVECGGTTTLADGYRRVCAAKSIGMKEIPAIVYAVDENPENVARTIRLLVNHHREGFFPSQRAHYLRLLSTKYGVSITDIARACGIGSSTLSKWVAVGHCSDEIQLLIDNKVLPIEAGYLIASLNTGGQELILERFRYRDKVRFDEVKEGVLSIHKKYPELKKHEIQPRSGSHIGAKHTHRMSISIQKSGLSIPEMAQRIIDKDAEIRMMRKEILAAKSVIQRILNSKARLLVPDQYLRTLVAFSLEESDDKA